MKNEVMNTKKMKIDVVEKFLLNLNRFGFRHLSDVLMFVRLGRAGGRIETLSAAAGLPEFPTKVQRMNVTNMVDRLEGLGLVVRDESETSRKHRAVQLTVRGFALWQQLS